MKYDSAGRVIYGFPLDEDLTVTGTWTFDSNMIINGDAFATNDPALYVTASDARIYLRDSGGSADEKMWGFRADSDALHFSTRSDDDTSGVNWLQVDRTGTTVTNVAFTATNASFSTALDIGTSGAGVTLGTGGGPIHLNAVDSIGDCWMGFYEDDRSTRKGYLGYGSSSTNTYFIEQEETADTADIRIRTNSTGAGGAILLMPNRSTMVNVNATGVAFHGATPAARPDYTVTNPSTDRALNVTADTTAQVAAVLGTLIADLIAIGLLQ